MHIDELFDPSRASLIVTYEDPEGTSVDPFGSRWTVQLVGDPAILLHLPIRHAGPDRRVISIDERYYLHLSEFEGLSDHDEVRSSAAKFTVAVNGWLAIQFRGFIPIGVGAIARDNGDGTVTMQFPVHDWAVQGKSVAPSAVGPNNAGIKLVDLAYDDEAVMRVFRFMGQQSTYQLDAVTLYKILELIEEDLGGGSKNRGLKRLTDELRWVSSDEIEDFENTVHNPGAIGDEARHALGRKSRSLPRNYESPQAAMRNARAFIERLAVTWLDWKHQQAFRVPLEI